MLYQFIAVVFFFLQLRSLKYACSYLCWQTPKFIQVLHVLQSQQVPNERKNGLSE